NIIKLDIDNLNCSDYSTVLASHDFWNRINGDKILLYQEDTCIFRSNIDDFLEYDYIGAPWMKRQNDNTHLVGNGGFSLRSKQSMLDVIDKISLTNTVYNSTTLQYMDYAGLTIPPEDVYFSKNMIEFGIGKVADWETAKRFSVE